MRWMAIVALCGCATYAERLNSDGDGTRVARSGEVDDNTPMRVRVERSEPPPGCVARGFVEGSASSLGSNSYENTIRALQRQAAKRNANWVTIDATGMRNAYASTTRGRAFLCSDEALAAPGTPPTPSVASSQASDCEPDCSPGYTCLRGRCVSACNPPCGSGERCGADRICH